jgi:YHS domain-containing protein
MPTLIDATVHERITVGMHEGTPSQVIEAPARSSTFGAARPNQSDDNRANPITFISRQRRVRHMVKDPVCGQDIEREAAVTWSYEGELYYFCSERCREEFEDNPDLYLNPDR